MNTSIKFAKVRPDAIIPTKKEENAAFDIYANFKDPYMVIPAHSTKMVPSGIASVCDTDYCFILKERGSTGTKGMAQRCGVIDSGFRGEWFIPITNTTDRVMYIAKIEIDSSEDAIVYPYTKAIAQAMVVPVPKVEVEEVSYEELINIESERGTGMLGSSGK